MATERRVSRLAGEFIVIVVGVVVALGVDRWVQALDEAEAEREHLELVRRDLEGNLQIFNEIRRDWSAAADAAGLLLAALGEDGLRPPDPVLLAAVARAGTVNTQPARDGSFRAMETTGALRYIRDADLRAEIVAYFTQEIRDGRPMLEERSDLRFRAFARSRMMPQARETADQCRWPTPTAACDVADPPSTAELWAALNREPEVEAWLRSRLNDGLDIAAHTATWIEATERLLAELPDRGRIRSP